MLLWGELSLTELDYAIGRLRHLYELMVTGYVTDAPEAARGLLGPAIERIEKWRDTKQIEPVVVQQPFPMP